MVYGERGLIVVVFFLMSMYMVGVIFEPGKRKAIMVRDNLLIAVILLGSTIGYEYFSGLLTMLINRYEEARGGGITQLGNITLTIDGFIRNMIPAIAVLVGLFWLYQGKREEKLFTGMLILLIQVIVQHVFCEITNLPFSPGVTDKVRDYPPTVIRIGIMIFWMSIAAFCFRRFLRGYILDMLSRIKGQEGKIQILPAASYVVFCLVLSVLDLLRASFRSTNKANVYVAAIVIIGMIVMYALIYTALFQAVEASARVAAVQADLIVASNIQQSALPTDFEAFSDYSEFEIYAGMRPAAEVGGDFYDFFLISENELAILIADVSGKGVPAALFMMAGKTTIRNQATLRKDPGEILCYANEQLLENNSQGLFITVFFGILDLKTGVLNYANAGHNPPVLIRENGSVELMKIRSGFVLGGMEGIRYRTQQIVLKPGEKILLYTDGVTEAVNEKMELYGEERMLRAVEKNKDQSVRQLIESVNRDVDSYAEHMVQADDITMLMVQYKGVKT